MTDPSGSPRPDEGERADAAAERRPDGVDATEAGDAPGVDATGVDAPGGDEPGVDAPGEFGRQFAAAAEKSGLGALAREEKLSGRDLLTAVGGVRGILEALLPGLVFLLVYSGLTSFAGQDPQAALVPALVASIGLAVLFTLARLVAKGQPTQAIAGLIGVLASAALALWSGDARDNYVLGFFTNAGYALALTVSLVVRWPAIGLIVGFLMGDGLAWKQDKRKYRAAQFLTIVWIGLFVARLAVQLPFYLADNVEALGAMRLLMGLPLYALVLIFSWLVVRAVYPSSARTAE